MNLYIWKIHELGMIQKDVCVFAQSENEALTKLKNKCLANIETINVIYYYIQGYYKYIEKYDIKSFWKCEGPTEFYIKPIIHNTDIFISYKTLDFIY